MLFRSLKSMEISKSRYLGKFNKICKLGSMIAVRRCNINIESQQPGLNERQCHSGWVSSLWERHGAGGGGEESALEKNRNPFILTYS